jgi:hypothetical protein
MTIYLRNEQNNSLLDLEVWKTKDNQFEVRAGIPIAAYSELLLSSPKEDQDYIIEAFEDLDNLRAWYWERFNEMNPGHTFKQLTEAIMEILKPIAERLKLYIVTD